ncbi:MAG: 3'-5' exonuclease [Paraglaciecola polaris]|uniref:3'-5' exonuclease n=1 Tax=Paraglaciecola polaris TaxID=222814 RepID=UPI0030020E33|tara:strand:+ start:2667 stop:3422 length:756 start_codon:yes stop_codon:yes gene_type:complete
MFYLDKNALQDKPTLKPSGGQFDWSSEFSKRYKNARYPALKQYYAQGAVSADTPICDVPLVALDFETTGLNPKTDSIVSIGLVALTTQRIRCAEAKHWIIKPDTELKTKSVVIHGITHSDVASAPSFNSVLDELLLHLQGKIVVAHHKDIETRFLNSALQHYIGEEIVFPCIDTMALEARFSRTLKRTFMRSLLGKKTPSIRLTDCRARYHLPYYRQHNALTDALACAELLQAQVSTHYPDETSPVSAIWC